MLSRKLKEIGSILYRTFIFPFVRINTEIKSNSIMKQGSYINKGTKLEGLNYIGKDTILSNVKVGYGSYVNSRCDISNTIIGKYTSIGANVSTNLGSHPVDGKHVALHPAFYAKAGGLGYSYASEDSYEEMKYLNKDAGIQIIIGNDVWIGNDVKLMEGITIGDGAVIGTGAVVTKDVEPYSVYAGVPAKKIKLRFSEEQIEELVKIKWWDKDEEFIRNNVKASVFDDVDRFISLFKEN